MRRKVLRTPEIPRISGRVLTYGVVWSIRVRTDGPNAFPARWSPERLKPRGDFVDDLKRRDNPGAYRAAPASLKGFPPESQPIRRQ
jgi:hypothetical protein